MAVGFHYCKKIPLTPFTKGANNASLYKGGATKWQRGFRYYRKNPPNPLYKRGAIMPPFIREVPRSGRGFLLHIILICIFCSLFFLFVAMQRERTDRRKRNMLYYGNALHCFIQNDAVKNRVFHLSASLSCYRTRSAFFLANSLPS